MKTISRLKLKLVLLCLLLPPLAHGQDTISTVVHDTVVLFRTDTVLLTRTDTVVQTIVDSAMLRNMMEREALMAEKEKFYKEIFTKMENVSYTYVNPSTGTKTEMPTEYWTAEQCGSDEAYYFSFENASSSMHKAKDPGNDAYAKPYVRPILWL